ncbi:hypothetical protein G6F24_018130 [Rhizopus arrhizus]|nr:hypothetical protein G6F24_018130 [Rhizopus arrhizus]
MHTPNSRLIGVGASPSRCVHAPRQPRQARKSSLLLLARIAAPSHDGSVLAGIQNIFQILPIRPGAIEVAAHGAASHRVTPGTGYCQQPSYIFVPDSKPAATAPASAPHAAPSPSRR